MSKYSDNALVIYKNLYYSQGESSPTDVHKRVAEAVANTDEEYRQFFNLLDNKIFRPNTPALINAKKDNCDNLFACFVLGLEDSMESIIEMWSTASLIYASGAGCGIPITNLREKGSPISVGGTASGALEYLNTIEIVSRTVRSGGKSRRAANLASCKYNHPDILKIIRCKQPDSEYKFTAINLSILVDDLFMNKVAEKDFEFEIDLISPNKNKKVGTITVGELWKNIIECAWNSGDPGLLFYDNCNRTNPNPSDGEIKASNPCGEVLLPDWSCCNLGAINLNQCLTDDEDAIDWKKFESIVKLGVRFLDNMIDKSSYINEKFKEHCLKTRPIGHGLMGFADILYKLRKGYNTAEASHLFSNICRHLTRIAYETSIDLAEEKGPATLDPRDCQHFRELLKYYDVSNDYIKKFDNVGIRNLLTTSIAPTGSVSISADCSYSFEPMMALVWEKELVDNKGNLTFVNEIFMNEVKERKILEQNNISEEQLFKDIINHKGSIQLLDYIPKDMKEVYVVAHDIKWQDRINMQAEGQRYITLGISSTCNLPNSATKEEVSSIYLTAWKKGLKGITIFRDGCLKDQIVKFGSKENYQEKKDKSSKIVPMKRPLCRSGITSEVKTNIGNLYVTINYDKECNPFEVFLNIGDIGQLDNLLLNTLARVISKSLQYGLPYNVITDTIMNMGSDQFWFKFSEDDEKSTKAMSIIDAVAKVINYHCTRDKMNVENNKLENINNISVFEKCPQCGKRTLTRSSGCKGGLCTNENCLYTTCG